MLQEVIAAAEGTDGAAEEKNEMEELKQLLPDIREKVEDAKESQRTGSAASQAIQQTLVSTVTRNKFTKHPGSERWRCMSVFEGVFFCGCCYKKVECF